MLPEHIKLGPQLWGLNSAGIAHVVHVTQVGRDALNVTFRRNRRVSERLVYRGEERTFALVEAGRVHGFDADSGMLRLGMEA